MNTRVLIADDHKLIRDAMLALVAQQPDLEVIGMATDGIEAVELSLLFQPDIVLMDISMPQLSGFEAARLLARRCPKVKVIALSIHDREVFRDSMKSIGVKGFVEKSTAADDLIPAIRAVNAGGRFFPHHAPCV